MATVLPPAPRRLLFIASIGNQAPYRRTRHSAGHLLLDVVGPLLRTRVSGAAAPYYTTWYSPSFMNESGPKLVRQMQKWFAKQDEAGTGMGAGPTAGARTGRTSGYPATLVILHDELEAPLGKIRVKRGGPEQASLRGHRGLISVLESLRGRGLYPPRQPQSQVQNQNARRGTAGKDTALPRELSILRIGIGIGRPPSREKNAVADYVLSEMDADELGAVQRAAEPVVGVLAEELWQWSGGAGESEQRKSPATS
ncbi:uncharacterized protein N7459_003848 [Penicillium hispanicum]|uniref:uncharacterized protein n=1 Tax=Penicillium hispanicum TaxID=1080232 RepID=UPI002540A6D8|nr:uncharacterized protein N7459_003848 [Penicillium hispanicum]KAJ5584048.1 hypothetical protein N7459_003848 [Penicillium hispanicum]